MPSIIDDLADPGRLPDETDKVQVVQTHISIVFIARDYVYKVKKPVDFGFLDFSTLEKRAHFCRQEVVLNRRLSKDLYLDVLPIRLDEKRHTLRAGPGEAVEYAVKMRRVPEERLMLALFERGDLAEGHLEQVARVLAEFHGRAQRSPEIDRFGEAERFKVNTDENFEQVEKYVGATIRGDLFQDLKTWTEDFYRTHGGRFPERIAQGRIRDCHGDLHMEHVCLGREIAVFDCIEFNDRFRYSDTVADIAFLLMDLEYHGGERFSEMLWEAYKQAAGEGEVDDLLAFYKVYRAFVRGKVTSFQLDDDRIDEAAKEKAVSTARKYFELAHSYLS